MLSMVPPYIVLLTYHTANAPTHTLPPASVYNFTHTTHEMLLDRFMSSAHLAAPVPLLPSAGLCWQWACRL